MKKILYLFVFVPFLTHGQIAYDFEQGNLLGWSQYLQDSWKADTTGALNGNFSLHHVYDNEDAGTEYIAAPLSSLHPEDSTTTWSFNLRHGYNPSSNNNWAVWLMASESVSTLINDPDNQSGYAIGVNLTGSDDILKIWRIVNGQIEIIIETSINWQEDIGTLELVHLSVQRTFDGTWSLFSEFCDTLISAQGHDPMLTDPQWFIIQYEYSANYDRLLWIDDLWINGKFYADTVAPLVQDVYLANKSTLGITFSEPIMRESISADSFMIGETANRGSSIIWKTNRSIEICFEDPLVNKKYNTLVVSSISDVSGNIGEQLTYCYLPVWGEPGDIIFTEIMADPTPSVMLPEKEYMEIFNRTDHTFKLKNWKITINQNEEYLFNDSLCGGEYAIICNINDTSVFSQYGRTIGVETIPSLPNTGGILMISNNFGDFIHGAEYRPDWYGSDLKTSGGWALELIDNNYPFSYDGNWIASICSQGGTPGFQNSVTKSNPDNLFEGIQNVFPVNGTTVEIDFSETVIDPLLENKLICEGSYLNSIVPADSLRREYLANLPFSMVIGKIYTIEIGDRVKDFTGNTAKKTNYDFGLTSPVNAGELVFNEIMFNPLPGEPDYIELYNCSKKIINISELSLASISTVTGDTSNLIPVYPKSFCLMPGSFFVVTTNTGAIIASYPNSDPYNIFSLASFPSMPDNQGHLLLLNKELTTIDEVIYTEKMHFSLLSDNEGVSLEKVRPELPSMESSSWHSSAESSGFGTPGSMNSVYYEGISTENEDVQLSTNRLTPDNDGFQDLMEISFSLNSIGNVAMVSIFSENGKLVCKLAENMTIENGAVLFWDGTMPDGTPLNNGIYIILVDIFNDQGKQVRYKKVCTVIRDY